MDNNRIINILVIFVIILNIIICYYCLKFNSCIQENSEKINTINESIAFYLDSVATIEKQIINKKQEIYNNNTYIYNTENEKIANYSDSITDSLFQQNLRTGYERFGWMLNNK